MRRAVEKYLEDPMAEELLKGTVKPGDTAQVSIDDNGLTFSSSKTTKESTTLGFNGIDPSGKVDQKMLATTPGAKDQEQVKKMSDNLPTAADVKSFLQEGGLNAK